MSSQRQQHPTLHLMIGLFVIFILTFMQIGHVVAQSASTADGTFCVRAFEDPNGNGIYDPNEFTLKGGISVNLLEANGIVIASALLENSPDKQRERGIVCFGGLSSGQYSIEVVSADFRATTASVMTDVIVAGGSPVMVDFGAHRLADNPTPQVSTTNQGVTEAQIMRIVLSLAGAVVVIVIMSVLGFFIYLIGYRRRLVTTAPIDDYYRRPPTATATQGMRPVSSTSDTGEFRSQR